MSKKGWKEHILSCGLPLEYSVQQILESLQFDQPPIEYSYERVNEHGVPVTFSVDLSSIKSLGPEPDPTGSTAMLQVLVECKYRHENTKWVFTPSKLDGLWGPTDQETLVVVDALLRDHSFNWGVWVPLMESFGLCGKGIEILPDNSNPKAIREAVNQLKYAVINEAVDTALDQLPGGIDFSGDYDLPDMLMYQHMSPYLMLHLPIIVTTAELWRMRQGVSVEDVRSAENIEDIAEKVDACLLSDNPDRSIRNFLDRKVTAAIGDDLSRIKKRFPRFGLLLSGLESNPMCLWVVNYAAFSNFMESVLAQLESAPLLTQHSSQT